MTDCSNIKTEQFHTEEAARRIKELKQIEASRKEQGANPFRQMEKQQAAQREQRLKQLLALSPSFYNSNTSNRKSTSEVDRKKEEEERKKIREAEVRRITQQLAELKKQEEIERAEAVRAEDVGDVREIKKRRASELEQIKQKRQGSNPFKEIEKKLKKQERKRRLGKLSKSSPKKLRALPEIQEKKVSTNPFAEIEKNLQIRKSKLSGDRNVNPSPKALELTEAKKVSTNPFAEMEKRAREEKMAKMRRFIRSDPPNSANQEPEQKEEPKAQQEIQEEARNEVKHESVVEIPTQIDEDSSKDLDSDQLSTPTTTDHDDKDDDDSDSSSLSSLHSDEKGHCSDGEDFSDLSSFESSDDEGVWPDSPSHLSSEDLATAKQGERWGEQVLHYALSKLSEEIPSSKRTKVYSPKEGQTLCEFGRVDPPSFDTKKIFIPFRYDDGHWCLLEVYEGKPKEHAVIANFFDSSPFSTTKDFFQYRWPYLNFIFQTMASSRIFATVGWKTKSFDIKRQDFLIENQVDDGAFILECIKARCNDQPISDITSEILAKRRQATISSLDSKFG